MALEDLVGVVVTAGVVKKVTEETLGKKRSKKMSHIAPGFRG